MSADPRGPARKIVRIEEGTGPTMITKECGHRSEYANHFTYKVGATVHCIQCLEGESLPGERPVGCSRGCTGRICQDALNCDGVRS